MSQWLFTISTLKFGNHFICARWQKLYVSNFNMFLFLGYINWCYCILYNQISWWWNKTTNKYRRRHRTSFKTPSYNAGTPDFVCDDPKLLPEHSNDFQTPESLPYCIKMQTGPNGKNNNDGYLNVFINGVPMDLEHYDVNQIVLEWRTWTCNCYLVSSTELASSN